MLTTGFLSLFSSLMYTITSAANDDKWFSRFSLGVVCIGFYCLINNKRT